MAGSQLKGSVYQMVRQHMIIILLTAVIIGMLIIGDLVSPGFSSFGHVKDILRTASFVGICAIGQTMVILTGGIDLSIGALITMGQIYGCVFVNGSNANTGWAFLAVAAIGGLFGMINGSGVSVLKISPLVMTLATSSLVSGVTLISIQGAPRGVASPLLEKIGAGFCCGLPSIVWVWILLAIIVLLFLRKTVVGRKIYHLGMNVTAAKFTGIRTETLRTLVYAMSGMLSAVTGFLLAGNTSRAFLDSGKVYTMWSITAVVIGGTAMSGGSGGYAGTAAGAIIIIMLEGILTVIKMPESGRKIANGLIVLIMIMIYYRKKRR